MTTNPKALIKFNTKIGAKQNGISFRIIFLSPFFELEVRNGNQRWQTVRAQEPVIDANSNKHYAIQNFLSYEEAFDYASDVLKLYNMERQRWWQIFSAIPASSFETRTSHDDTSLRGWKPTYPDKKFI